MRAVLDKMMELESYNEVIELLRGVIRTQEEIREDAREASARADVKAVIVYGGPKVFAAGADIVQIDEPWIKATIYTPDEYLGSILKLCQDRRGIQTHLTYVGGRAQATSGRVPGWLRSAAISASASPTPSPS